MSLTPDHILIPNTMEPRIGKPYKPGSFFSDVSETIRTLSEPSAGHALDATGMSYLPDSVRCPSKARQRLDKTSSMKEH